MKVQFLHGKSCACFHSRETWLLGLFLQTEALSTDTDIRLHTDSLHPEELDLLRIGLWDSSTASMHFHGHKEEISNFKDRGN